MIRKIAILLLLLPSLLYGQKTKKVTIEHSFSPVKEIYYVLKSDTSVWHGPYCVMKLDGKILLQGYFKSGKRDSLWTEYNAKGILRSKGYYSDNKRSGVWEFYDDHKNLQQKIDFDNELILSYRTKHARQPFRIISNKDTLMSVLERPPLFLGGESRMNDFISGEIAAPFHKPKEKTKGTVYIELTIDSTGKSSDIHVLKGIGLGCNMEALRVAKLIPDEWLPGVFNGRNVTVKYIIPILFDEYIPLTNIVPEIEKHSDK